MRSDRVARDLSSRPWGADQAASSRTRAPMTSTFTSIQFISVKKKRFCTLRWQPFLVQYLLCKTIIEVGHYEGCKSKGHCIILSFAIVGPILRQVFRCDICERRWVRAIGDAQQIVKPLRRQPVHVGERYEWNDRRRTLDAVPIRKGGTRNEPSRVVLAHMQHHICRKLIGGVFR